jgi:PAS domain S-box-containing protein
METDDGHWSVHPTYAQLIGVIDALNAGILVRTVEGRIVFANARMLHWVGYEAEELDGQDVRILVPDEMHEHLEDDLQEIHSGDERLRITILQRKNGRTMPTLICPHLLRRGDQVQVVVTVVMDLGEVQTARHVESRRDRGLAAGLRRIAHELHSISLFAGAAGVAQVPHDHPEIHELSPREREILAELVAGQRGPAIAQKLYISPHTVRNHLKSMYRKLGVSSQAGLIEKIRALAP